MRQIQQKNLKDYQCVMGNKISFICLKHFTAFYIRWIVLSLAYSLIENQVFLKCSSDGKELCF